MVSRATLSDKVCPASVLCISFVFLMGCAGQNSPLREERSKASAAAPKSAEIEKSQPASKLAGSHSVAGPAPSHPA